MWGLEQLPLPSIGWSFPHRMHRWTLLIPFDSHCTGLVPGTFVFVHFPSYPCLQQYDTPVFVFWFLYASRNSLSVAKFVLDLYDVVCGAGRGGPDRNADRLCCRERDGLLPPQFNRAAEIVEQE